MSLNTVVLLLGTLFAAVQSATVLDGYLRRSSDDYCFKNNGGTPAMVEVATDLATDCTKVIVAGDATNGYTIVDAADATKKFTLGDTADTTALTFTDTATAFKFEDTSDNAVCGAGLDASGSPFLIDINTGAQTGSDCLKNDLTYANTDVATTCDTMLFYFETVDCSTITDCSLCYEDTGLKCSSCGNNKKPTGDNSACEACTNNEVADACGMTCTACGTAMTDCTACTAHDACTACTANTKALNENDNGCIDCGTAITDCNTCASNAGDNTCSACDNDKVPDANGASCVTCGTAMTDCTACTAHDACTACTANTKALNENDNGCIDCGTAITDCTTCASTGGANTCTACGNSKVPHTNGATCVACDAAMDDCNTCTSYDACTACKNNKVLNQAGTACEDLQGYLVFQGATKCFKMDGSSASSVAPTTISDDCTKVKLSDHGTAGYILVVAEDTTKQFTYAADTDATALTLSASGTAFQFVVGGNAVTAAPDLVNTSAPVLVVLNDGQTGGQDCVLEDLTYENTDATASCDSKGWYFKLDCSLVTDCDACTLDDMTKISCTSCGNDKYLSSGQCMTCASSKVVNAAGTGCEDQESSGNAILPMSLGSALLLAAFGKIIMA